MNTLIAGRVGRRELLAAQRRNGPLFAAAFLFSMFVNLLLLTAPLYMLQIYDRVLGSRSRETLVALTLLAAFLFLIMGILDYARGRVMARAGARFQSRLEHRVFGAIMRCAMTAAGPVSPATGLRDLESVQRLFTSPALLALFDIPWTPLFLLAIFFLHPWLGVLAIVGGAILILVTWLNQHATARPLNRANRAFAAAESISGQLGNEAELVQGLGMRSAAFRRWRQVRDSSLESTMLASDRAGMFTALSRTFRMFVQSAMLGLGAFLVLRHQLTGGEMIAGSILLGRALAPVDQVIAQWPVVQRALRAWQALGELLERVPPERARTPLPRPKARLDVSALTVFAPGRRQAVLRQVSFRLAPGQALAVVGTSGAGKSSLARAVIGLWPAAAGCVRLDGATLGQYDPDVLGRTIGYLPQRVALFDGSIAENIARLSCRPNPGKVVEAARKAAAHDMIVQLPDGYDTIVSAAGGGLSGGQIQRIGLARALYGDPVLLVLDEPDSNLDNDGSMALNAAIRGVKSAGGAVIVMAHRPAAIQECDLVLMLEGGARSAFGPRDEVLRRMVRNATRIQHSAAGSAGAP